jgi:RNA polymerase sigma-70 factor (ECF subfamily)
LDKQIVKELLAGKETAFNNFFDNYFPRLYRFALTRMKNDEEAIKDIVQVTLTNAIRSMKTYRGEASLFTWMCQICRNEINAYFRKQNRESVLVPEDDVEIRGILETLEASEESRPTNRFEITEIQKLVQVTLDHLPIKYANALEWKYIEGFSVNEIADKLDVGPVAVQSILARARTAFREAMESLSGLGAMHPPQ